MKGHVYGLQNDFRVWLLIYNFFFFAMRKENAHSKRNQNEQWTWFKRLEVRNRFQEKHHAVSLFRQLCHSGVAVGIWCCKYFLLV